MFSCSSIKHTLPQRSSEPSLPPPTILHANATTCGPLTPPLMAKLSRSPKFEKRPIIPCNNVHQKLEIRTE